MIVDVNTELNRVATLESAGYSNKKMSELEEYVQTYDFTQPLINWIPVDTVDASIGDGGEVIYPLNCKIQFLKKAVKSNNLENSKDALNDEMILLAQEFFRELNKNENLIFKNWGWSLRFKVLRPFITSNFLVGIEVSVTLETSCNRLP
jgi:hypothetical protein